MLKPNEFSWFEGTQKITTFYPPTELTKDEMIMHPQRDPHYHPMQDRMDQRPDARRNL